MLEKKMKIQNSSAGVVIVGYALNPAKQLVWLDLAPEHPKTVEAIWASLVANTGEHLRILDQDPDRHAAPQITHVCKGLGHRYQRFTIDVPTLVDNVTGLARPKCVRLIAPEVLSILEEDAPFGALAWPGISCGSMLALMLERGTAVPIQIGWGDYLLAEARTRGAAKPLTTGGTAPAGYWLETVPWSEIISEGLKAGHIDLAGGLHRLPVELPQVKQAAPAPA